MTTSQQTAKHTPVDEHNLPLGLHPVDKERYLKLQAEIAFNEKHGVNLGYTEHLKDSKFAIINGYFHNKISAQGKEN